MPVRARVGQAEVAQVERVGRVPVLPVGQGDQALAPVQVGVAEQVEAAAARAAEGALKNAM